MSFRCSFESDNEQYVNVIRSYSLDILPLSLVMVNIPRGNRGRKSEAPPSVRGAIRRGTQPRWLWLLAMAVFHSFSGSSSKWESRNLLAKMRCAHRLDTRHAPQMVQRAWFPLHLEVK